MSYSQVAKTKTGKQNRPLVLVALLLLLAALASYLIYDNYNRHLQKKWQREEFAQEKAREAAKERQRKRLDELDARRERLEWQLSELNDKIEDKEFELRWAKTRLEQLELERFLHDLHKERQALLDKIDAVPKE